MPSLTNIFSRLPVAAKSRWVRYSNAFRPEHDAGQILVLAFSKDRPLQLDLLLRTLRERVMPQQAVHVLYRASNEDCETAYRQVFSENIGLGIVPHPEASFKDDLLRICRGSHCRFIMFLVDDIAFIRPVNLNEIATLSRRGHIVSIRLGLNITRAQTEGGAVRHIPLMTPVAGMTSRFLTWEWYKADPGHWSMPTALDGNVLPLPELVPVLEATAFKAPNSLEAAIGQYRFLFKYTSGVCYDLPRIVNFPLNSVKTENFDFPHMGMSVEDMLEIYNNGGRLDVADFPHVEHDSCHMEWVPKIKYPAGVGGHAPSFDDRGHA